MNVIIEKCNTAQGGGFAAYNTDSDNVIISGSGPTVSAAKDDFFAALHDVEASYAELGEELPAELAEPVELHFSIASVFDAMPWLNVSKVAEAFGLNKSLLHQYKSGKAYISDERLVLIENGLHALGAELCALSLR